MFIFADAMATLQEKSTTKGKWTSRRLIDGLFGNRNARQQLEEMQQQLEEMQRQLQDHVRLTKEREDKLGYYESIGQQATVPVSHLIETLKLLVSEDATPELHGAYATMMNDAELLSELLRQFLADASYYINNVSVETDREESDVSAVSGKHPVLVLATQDEATGQRLKDILSRDYHIRLCHNGWQALAEVYRNGADAILAEVQMNTMDGLAMCKRLRSNPQTRLIPVILLANNNEQRVLALQHSADACIATTAEADVITCSVSNLLKGRRQMQLNYEQQRWAEQHETPITKKKAANEKLMDRVMDIINKNLKDTSLSVEMIAGEVGISRMHLNRKMKEIVGLSPHDLIRQVRLERAARLLAAGDVNIAEVVYACGFVNAASFATTFKRVYGLTPSEYMAEKKNSFPQQNRC